MNTSPDTHETIILTQDPNIAENEDKISPLKYIEMIKKIQSWGVFMLVFGFIYIFSAADNFSVWGISLVLAGVLSLLFKTRDIFVLNAIIIFWAAFSNITSGNIFWMIFSLTQVYFGIRIFKDFNQSKNINNAELQEPELEKIKITRHKKAEKFIPLLAFLLGLLAMILFVTFFVIMFSTIIKFEGAIPLGSFEMLTNLVFNIAYIFSLLAFSLGLSALLCKYSKTVFSILGLVCSSLILFSIIILTLLSL